LCYRSCNKFYSVSNLVTGEGGPEFKFFTERNASGAKVFGSSENEAQDHSAGDKSARAAVAHQILTLKGNLTFIVLDN